jgi:hypothetical protein
MISVNVSANFSKKADLTKIPVRYTKYDTQSTINLHNQTHFTRRYRIAHTHDQGTP